MKNFGLLRSLVCQEVSIAMGVVPSKIPAKVDRETFVRLIRDYGGIDTDSPDCDANAVFEGLCDPAGFISREGMYEAHKASDVFLSHEWGWDEEGRNTHDRVSVVNRYLKKAGLITWFDEDREREMDACMQDTKVRAREGITNTQVVLVFITKRYVEMLEEDESDTSALFTGSTASQFPETNKDHTNSVRNEFSHALACKKSVYSSTAENQDNKEDTKDDTRGTSIDIDIIEKSSLAKDTHITHNTYNTNNTNNETQTHISPPFGNTIKPKYFKNIYPVVMEKCMSDPSSWGVKLRTALAGRMKFDLSEFTDLTGGTEGNLNKLVGYKEKEIKTEIKEERNVYAVSAASKAGSKSGRASAAAAVREAVQQEQLAGIVEFARCAVGGTLLKGGPFVNRKGAKQFTTAGRHYRWLREMCHMEEGKANRYSMIFARHKFDSTSKLYHMLERADGAKYMRETLGISDPTDYALITKQLRLGLTGNTERKAQENILDEMAKDKREEENLNRDYRNKIALEKAWVDAWKESEIMTYEDDRSRHAADHLYRIRNSKAIQHDRKIRHVHAIELDNRLRESELMGREGIRSSYARTIENERQKRLRMMSHNTDVHAAFTCIRQISERLQRRLLTIGPPGLQESLEKEEGIFSGIKAITEPSGTEWSNLMEEAVYALVMVRELSCNRPDRQALLAELGIGKYAIACLPEEITRVSNEFKVGSSISSLDEREEGMASLSAAQISLLQFTTANQNIFTTTLAQAGITCLRFLVNCRPVDSHNNRIDETAMDDRQIYLMGRDGAIMVVIRVIKMYVICDM